MGQANSKMKRRPPSSSSHKPFVQASGQQKIQANSTISKEVISETAKTVGRFSSYLGLNKSPIYRGQMQAVLVKQMLSQLEPVDGWQSSALTELKYSLHENRYSHKWSTQIVLDSKQQIGGTHPPEIEYEALYGSGQLTMLVDTVRKLANTARIVTHASTISAQLFLAIQLELHDCLEQQERRTVREIIVESKKSVDEWRKRSKLFNYSDLTRFEQILDTPIMLLASNVCHSQEVFFFVEQHYENGLALNKLRNGCLDSATPSVLLSIPGINLAYSGFQVKFSGENMEVAKYPADVIASNLWECVLESAQLHACQVLVIPPIGLGVFGGAYARQMAEVYFRTLFKTLVLPKYRGKLTNIFYNPLRFSKEFEKYRMELPIDVRETVELFGGDVKMLAIELSKHNVKCALVNPSDADVVLGVHDVGEYYKQGHYAMEEDIGATSTAVLGSWGINDVYKNAQKITSVGAANETGSQHKGVLVKNSKMRKLCCCGAICILMCIGFILAWNVRQR